MTTDHKPLTKKDIGFKGYSPIFGGLIYESYVRSAVEGYQSEDFHVNVGRIKCVKCGIYKAVVTDDRAGKTLCFSCVHKKWFPVFVNEEKGEKK